MSILEVPDARLYYETRGGGPLMLMVPGTNGEADIFKMVAEHLVAHCTVVTYDRRGFCRRQLEGPQDYDHRLETDADDVRRLIERLSDELPAGHAGYVTQPAEFAASLCRLLRRQGTHRTGGQQR